MTPAVPWWSRCTTPYAGSLHVRQTGLALHFGEGYSFCRYDHLLLTQQVTHRCGYPVHRELFAKAHFAVTAVGGKEFVFTVQQVEQGALAQAELLLIGFANTRGVIRVITCFWRLQSGVFHGIPGQGKVFVKYTQGVVADVHRLIDLMGSRLQARLVAHTVEQVVVHYHSRTPTVVMTFIALGVVVGIGG